MVRRFICLAYNKHKLFVFQILVATFDIALLNLVQKIYFVRVTEFLDSVHHPVFEREDLNLRFIDRG
jgi:hypothetical protein